MRPIFNICLTKTLTLLNLVPHFTISVFDQIHCYPYCHLHHHHTPPHHHHCRHTRYLYANYYLGLNSTLPPVVAVVTNISYAHPFPPPHHHCRKKNPSSAALGQDRMTQIGTTIVHANFASSFSSSSSSSPS